MATLHKRYNSVEPCTQEMLHLKSDDLQIWLQINLTVDVKSIPRNNNLLVKVPSIMLQILINAKKKPVKNTVQALQNSAIP